MLIVSLGKWGWNKYKTHKELKVEEKNEIETIKETSAKDYAENLLNEADKDDEIVDIIIELVIFFDGTVMLYAGLKLAYSSRTNLSTALSVPMWCINSSVAVGGILLMFQAFVAIAMIVSATERKEDKPVL